MPGKVAKKVTLNISELVYIHIHAIYKYILLIYDHCVELACLFHLRYIKHSFREVLSTLFLKKVQEYKFDHSFQFIVFIYL